MLLLTVMFTSCCNGFTIPCQALKYVSFAVQMLGKSFKMMLGKRCSSKLPLLLGSRPIFCEPIADSCFAEDASDDLGHHHFSKIIQHLANHSQYVWILTCVANNGGDTYTRPVA